jgi:hypothetical protein
MRSGGPSSSNSVATSASSRFCVVDSASRRSSASTALRLACVTSLAWSPALRLLQLHLAAGALA